MLEQPSRRQQAINLYEQELAKYSQQARKEDTRRKILIGAMIMGDMKKNPKLERNIMLKLDKFLLRENDRKLFNFDHIA